MPVVDHPGAPSLASAEGAPAQFPNPPCARNNLPLIRLLYELLLERAIFICGKEVIDPSGKELCLDDDHRPRIRQWRMPVKAEIVPAPDLLGCLRRGPDLIEYRQQLIQLR